MNPTVIDHRQEQIEHWLVQRFLQVPEATPADIDLDRPFTDYPFDSVIAVAISQDLSTWLQCDLPITVFWDYPSISSLSRALAEQAGKGGDFG